MKRTPEGYRALSPKQCAAELLKIKDPVILIHTNPDGDAVGSGAALCEIYSQLGIDARLLSPDKIPARLDFIIENCGVRTADGINGKTPISVDAAAPSRLGELYSESAPPRLMIDHHEVGERFADGYIDPKASSSAEVIFDIARKLIGKRKIKLTAKLAYALYAAMSSDTGGFMYSNTSAKTHLYASLLVSSGIDTADINHRLFSSKTRAQIKAESFVGENMRTADGGRTAYAAFDKADLAALGLESADFETAIDIVRSLAGCEIALIAKETADGKYKISMRSTGADVASVAKRFGGGGHIRAAGCTVSAGSKDEAIGMLLKEMKKNQERTEKQ